MARRNRRSSLGLRLVLAVVAASFGVMMFVMAPGATKPWGHYAFGAFCLAIALTCVARGRLQEVVVSAIAIAIVGVCGWYVFVSLSDGLAQSIKSLFAFCVFALPALAMLFKTRFGLGYRPPRDTKYYYKRNWEEAREDQYEAWGAPVIYIETDVEHWPLRQLEIYANGTVLQYDANHENDTFGSLADTTVNAREYAPYTIAPVEFEHAWTSNEPMNR